MTIGTLLDKDLFISLSLSEKQFLLRNLSQNIKSKELNEDEEAVLSVALVQIYFQNEYKDLRKSLISLLQTLSSRHKQMITRSINSSLEILLHSLASDKNSGPSSLEKLSFLSSNFPLGEVNVLGHLNGVLGLCVDILRHLDGQLRKSMRSLTEKDTAMAEVLFTIQFVNRLLSKCLDETPRKGRGSTEFELACCRLFGFLLDVLSEESYYMDCLISSSIGIALLLKIFSPLIDKEACKSMTIIKDSLSAVVPGIFTEHIKGRRAFPVATEICFINAFISIIPIDSLATSSSASCFLTFGGHERSALLVLIEELLRFDSRSMTSTCKLIHSRTILTLTAKIRHFLEFNSSLNFKDFFHMLSSQSEVFHDLVDHLFHHLDDPMDVLRHQSRVSLDNLFFCNKKIEQLTKSESDFLYILALKHLNNFDWSIPSKYSPLMCLVKYVGAEMFLLVHPSLIQDLLAALNDQSMACHVTSFFNDLWSSSFRDLKKAKGDDALKSWFEVWVLPIMKTLQAGTHSQRICIAQFLLPQLFETNEECLEYMISLLMPKDREGAMNLEQASALVGCLRHVLLTDRSKRQMRLSSLAVEDILEQVINHEDEQLRLDGFSVLCEHHKTTEVVHRKLLCLIEKFVECNLDNQSPSFRQRMTTIIKKLFIRMSESGRFVQKKYLVECKRSNSNNNREMEMKKMADILTSYKDFLSRLSDLCFRSLHFGSSFPSRTSSLSILLLLNQYFPPHFDKKDSLLFEFKSKVSPSAVLLLVSTLSDSFEKNKQDALELLASVTLDSASIEKVFHLPDLFKTSLRLSESVRPQDCITASHLLKFLLFVLTWEEVETLIQRLSKTFRCAFSIGDLGDGNGARNRKCFAVVSWLMDRLEHHERIAKQNLLLASARRPMYPVVHCIARVLELVDWRSTLGCNKWKELVERLVNTCVNVANIVSVVVNDSSPEGNVPDDLGVNCGLDIQVDFTDAQPFLKDDDDGVCDSSDGDDDDDDEIETECKEEPQRVELKVRLMPEFLVVCCWRSIKETSLILGQISSSVPIIGGHDDDGDSDPEDRGLLSMEMVDKIANFFRDQLLLSRHRGAFELAYAGFIRSVRTMWLSPISCLQSLPLIWVEQLMERVKVNDPDDLCCTRRSAGVPYFFLAVVSTEPVINDGRCLKFVMKNLIGIASEPITADNTQHIHSRNILRVLFRDSSLSDQVQSFISDGIKVCIEGYNCTYWPVSNSSALLFSILIRRVFGIRKPRAGFKGRNLGMSGRAFFTRHPELFEYFLEQLSSLGSNSSSIKRGTFLILITLSNLSPSAGENSKSNVNIDGLVPHVMRCSYSKDIKIREMAAKALSSLVPKEQATRVLLEIFKRIEENIESGSSNQNFIHGSCMQIHQLLQSSDVSSILSSSLEGMSKVIDVTWNLRTMLSGMNPCLVTRHSFGTIIERLLFLSPRFDDRAEIFKKWRHEFSWILKLNLHQLCSDRTHLDVLDRFANLSMTSSSPFIQSFHPYFNQYATFLARCNLRLAVEDTSSPDGVSNFENLAEKMLDIDGGDVQLEVLKLMKCLVSSCTRKLQEMREDDEEFRIELCRAETETRDESGFLIGSFITEKVVCSITSIVVAENVFHLNLLQALSCLTEVFKLPSSSACRVLKENHVTRLFEISMKLTSENNFLEVQERALYLASHCCHWLFEEGRTNEAQKDFASLRHFCNIVNQRALSESSTSNLKLATSFALAYNCNSLLVGSDGLGCIVYRNWTSLMQLAQEEDLNIRQMSGSCIPHMHHHRLRDISFHNTNVNPTYGMKVLLEIFFCLHCQHGESQWSAKGLQVLSDWLRNDPIEHRDHQEVRLFDRGQLNPYADEARLILMIRNIIERLVDGISQSCTNGFSSPCVFNVDDGRVDGRGLCHFCAESEAWKDPKILASRLSDLEKEMESMRGQLERTNSIEALTRQSSLRKLMVAHLRSSSAHRLMEVISEERKRGKE